MKKHWFANFYFETFDQITPELLRQQGIQALVLDLDNTIADYDTLDPTETVRAWFCGLAEAGIRAKIISNNEKERVERFCTPLGIPYSWKSGKPRGGAIFRAMEELHSTRATTALVGDKITTDFLAAKRCGLQFYRVRSIHPRWKRRKKV